MHTYACIYMKVEGKDFKMTMLDLYIYETIHL
jgi:hypothetical protein